MKRRVRCRHGSSPVDLVRTSAPDNRAARRARIVLRCSLLAMLAAPAAGCSLSFPISGFDADDTPTGSIDRTVALLPPSLDREDLRRARAAMAVALDPQGNGGRSAWHNPQSGAHGAFTAAAAPFTDHDRVCRRFSAEVTPLGQAERRMTGSACREGDGSWTTQASGQA